MTKLEEMANNLPEKMDLKLFRDEYGNACVQFGDGDYVMNIYHLEEL